MECGYRVKEPRRICYDVDALSLNDTCAYGDLSSQALSLNGDSSNSYPGAPSSTVLHRFITEKFFDVLNMGRANCTAQMSAMLGGNFAMAMEAHQNPPDPGAAAPAGEPPGGSPAGDGSGSWTSAGGRIVFAYITNHAVGRGAFNRDLCRPG